MIIRTFLLFTLTTAVFAKPIVSYEQEITVLNELRAEQIITQNQYENRIQTIESIKPVVKNKTLGGTAIINGHVENTSAVPLTSQAIQLHEIIAGQQVYVDTIITDASGDFSFTGLNAGTYLVFQGSLDDDYLNYMWGSGSNTLCTVYVGDCRTPTASNQIVLAAAETRAGINFIPEIGGTISGSILESVTNNPLDTLVAKVVSPDGRNNYQLGAVLNNLTGSYTVKGIPDGDYRVYLQPDDYGQNGIHGDNQHIPVIYGGPQCNICERLLATGSGIGTILTIASANTITNINFSVEIGASISGNIVDNTSLNAVQNYAFIVLFNDSNSIVNYKAIEGTSTNPTADGSYFLGGLLAGNYYVQGEGGDYYQRELYNNRPCYFGGCYRNLGDLVSLASKENKVAINFLLEKGGLISGNIIDEITGLPIIGEAYNETILEVVDASGVVVGGAYAQNDGTYTTAKGIPAGTYSIRTGSMFQGQLTKPYVNEKYNDVQCAGIACDFSSPNIIVVTDATTSGIDFALTTGNSFTGTVTDLSTGAPIGGVHVLAYKEMSPGVVKFANWATTSRGDVPGGSAIGTFEVNGLPDGTYYARTGYGSDLPFFVSTFHNIGGVAPVGWIDILYDGMPCLAGCNVTLGTPIVLPVVATKTTNTVTTGPIIDFSLSQGAVISGLVVDFINHASLKDVTINVYNHTGTFMGSSITNSQGEYITRGLPAGTYYLTTSSYNNLLDVKYGNEFCYPSNCNPLDAQPISVTELETKINQNFILKTAYMHMFSNDFE